MSTRRTFPQRVEHGGHVARTLLVLAFRIVAFLLFAPAAWRALLAGDWLGLGLSLLCGIGMAALVAPFPSDT
jgi:hypothetical protein